MPVREFTDSNDREWRVWDVRPEHMHPITRSEDYLANFQDGWLAFESGAEKRRLEAPYPGNWTTMGIAALEELCRRARRVVRRAPQSDTGKQRAAAVQASEQAAIDAAHALITFSSPGGREWTVRLHECLDHAGEQQVVLRFTSNDSIVELPEWPSDWQTATVQEFALMMLDANPPRRRGKVGPQRRREDRVPEEEPAGVS